MNIFGYMAPMKTKIEYSEIVLKTSNLNLKEKTLLG